MCVCVIALPCSTDVSLKQFICVYSYLCILCYYKYRYVLIPFIKILECSYVFVLTAYVH